MDAGMQSPDGPWAWGLGKRDTGIKTSVAEHEFPLLFYWSPNLFKDEQRELETEVFVNDDLGWGGLFPTLVLESPGRVLYPECSGDHVVLDIEPQLAACKVWDMNSVLSH